MFLQLLIFAILASINCVPFKSELDEYWEKFKIQYNKTYKKDEEFARRLIWEQAVSIINNHNLEADMGWHSYHLGINEYSDLANKEFVEIMNRFNSSVSTSSPITFAIPFNSKLPREVDWRKKGLVSRVKNQGQCGSCWAFSATGSLEGQHAKKTGNMTELSEQNLVDCSSDEGNYGCAGGCMNYAFNYVKKNNGIDTEVSYPYRAKGGSCHFNPSTVGSTCMGYTKIPKGSEYALMHAVATVGPISVAIDASHMSFQLYRGGIYNERRCRTRRLDHAVLVVGYGADESGEEFWIVKNSWGTSWGIKGYILMSRNKRNQCGIANMASFPLV